MVHQSSKKKLHPFKQVSYTYAHKCWMILLEVGFSLITRLSLVQSQLAPFFSSLARAVRIFPISQKLVVAWNGFPCLSALLFSGHCLSFNSSHKDTNSQFVKVEIFSTCNYDNCLTKEIVAQRKRWK